MLLRSLAIALCPIVAAAAASAVAISDSGQGAVGLAPGTPDAHELSALAHEGGLAWLAASDTGATLFELDIAVSAASGQITTASVVGSQVMAAGTDLEGMALLGGGSVLLSDETGPAIREHDPADGSLLGSVAVPAIYAQARNNFSLESLALRLAPNPGDDALWTANEEALNPDGPLSDGSTGSRVRLQRFDENFDPDGQWAYLTDPYPGGPFFGLERSGVVDLLALSSGELLVLERSLSNQGYRHRIYEVDFAGATDTTNLSSLDTDPHTPVTKTLRFELSGAFANNFEGIALGPLLTAGDQSLLLVSDDANGQNSQSPVRAAHRLRSRARGGPGPRRGPAGPARAGRRGSPQGGEASLGSARRSRSPEVPIMMPIPPGSLPRLLFPLCAALLLGASAASALQPPPSLGGLEDGDLEALETLASHPEELREAALRASLHVDLLVEMQRLQDRSSAGFRDRIDSLEPDLQEQVWELVRVPGLLTELGGGPPPSDAELESLAARHPELEAALWSFGRLHHPLLVDLLTIHRSARARFEDMLEDLPDASREAFEVLVEEPELVSILTQRVRLAVHLGESFRADPDATRAHLAGLAVEVATRNDAAASDWERTLREDPEAAAEFEAAGQAYADSCDEHAFDVVHEVRVVHPYPYWFGYPVHYSHHPLHPWGYWRPYHHHYHGGYGFQLSFALPSAFFLHWFFDGHHDRYPHLTSHFRRHHRGHPRTRASGHGLVARWAREFDRPARHRGQRDRIHRAHFRDVPFFGQRRPHGDRHRDRDMRSRRPQRQWRAGPDSRRGDRERARPQRGDRHEVKRQRQDRERRWRAGAEQWQRDRLQRQRGERERGDRPRADRRRDRHPGAGARTSESRRERGDDRVAPRREARLERQRGGGLADRFARKLRQRAHDQAPPRMGAKRDGPRERMDRGGGGGRGREDTRPGRGRGAREGRRGR